MRQEKLLEEIDDVRNENEALRQARQQLLELTSNVCDVIVGFEENLSRDGADVGVVEVEEGDEMMEKVKVDGDLLVRETRKTIPESRLRICSTKQMEIKRISLKRL